MVVRWDTVCTSPEAGRPAEPVSALRWPAGLEPTLRGSRPRVLPLHHGHHEAGTTGLEPAPSRLTSERSARLSYAPGLQLRGWDSNPRSRAHEAREDSRSSTARRCGSNLAGRGRTCSLRRPKPAGFQSPTTSRYGTPGGTRTRSFRVESPASSPFDHGGVQLRRQGSNLCLASNSRASCQLDHTGMRGRRGSRTLKARRPTRFRDGIPRRWQSFHEVTPAGVEPATARVRAGSSAVLSYGAEE